MKSWRIRGCEYLIKAHDYQIIFQIFAPSNPQILKSSDTQILKSTHQLSIMNKSIVLTLVLLLTLTTASFAQKFGFCNSSALLAELPEVKAADSELKAFQTQLTKKGQDMVKALQDKAAELQRKKNRA